MIEKLLEETLSKRSHSISGTTYNDTEQWSVISIHTVEVSTMRPP